MEPEEIEEQIDILLKNAMKFECGEKYTHGFINGLTTAKNFLLRRKQKYVTLEEMRNGTDTLQKGV